VEFHAKGVEKLKTPLFSETFKAVNQPRYESLLLIKISTLAANPLCLQAKKSGIAVAGLSFFIIVTG